MQKIEFDDGMSLKASFTPSIITISSRSISRSDWSIIENLRNILKTPKKAVINVLPETYLNNTIYIEPGWEIEITGDNAICEIIGSPFDSSEFGPQLVIKNIPYVTVKGSFESISILDSKRSNLEDINANSIFCKSDYCLINRCCAEVAIIKANKTDIYKENLRITKLKLYSDIITKNKP